MNAGRVFFCGDTHGELGHLAKITQEFRPDALVLLGDIQARRPLEKELEEIMGITEVWWIPGNHDTDSDADHDHVFESEFGDRNLHGRIVDVAGHRIAGLGGIFRGQVWMPPNHPTYETPEDYCARCGKGNLWRGGLPRKHRSTIFPSDCHQFLGQQADILVTHEAPSCHPHGFTVLDELARGLGVKATFHGHHHEWPDYSGSRSRLGFMPYGIGLRGVVDERGVRINGV